MIKRIALMVLPVIVLAGLFYVGANHAPYQEPTAPPDRDPKMWKRGRIMYQSQCTSCHNSNPDLPGSIGPKLRGVTQELLVERLTNGKGAMPPRKNLVRFAKDFREYLK